MNNNKKTIDIKKNEDKSIFYYVFKTVLEIIEDKPNFVMPLVFYYILIMIFLFQISGYVFSNFEVKTIYDPKASYIANVNEIAPITFLLYLKGNDNLTFGFFILM